MEDTKSIDVDEVLDDGGENRGVLVVLYVA